MPAVPWKSFFIPDGDGEHHAVLPYLPRNTFRALPKFMRYASQIRSRLAGSGGLIGYSMDAHVPSPKFRTLWVWEGEESLPRFVRGTLTPG